MTSLVRSPSRGRTGDLEWLGGILAAPPVMAIIGRPRSLAATSARETFSVLPTARRPHVVIPLASRRAAAQALGGASYARGIHMRLARALCRIGVRTGIAQHLFRGRLCISGGDLEGRALSQVLLSEQLMEIFGRRDVAIAVHLGPPRPNRKPLVQVLCADGELLGYAKIGWNQLTSDLVRHEARVLTDIRQAMPSSATFELPRVLHTGRWRDLELLVLSPLRGRSFSLSRAHLEPIAAAMNEILRLFEADETRLAESEYWMDQKARVSGTRDAARLVHLAGLVEERYGEEVLAFGFWHGDWAPWNMAWRGGRVAIWDWERSSRSVPVGLDAAHFDFQVALARSRHRSLRALRQTVGSETPMLSLLELPHKRDRLLLSLHLLEMALRWDEGNRAGMIPPDSMYAQALAALLADPGTGFKPSSG